MLEIETAEAIDLERLTRHFDASSSCGVCGQSSLKALATLAEPVRSEMRVAPEFLLRLPEHLAAAQATFAHTGSLHGTAIFQASPAPGRRPEPNEENSSRAGLSAGRANTLSGPAETPALLEHRSGFS